MTTTINSDAIIAEAKRLSGLTWAEFDYALTLDGVGEVAQAVGSAACTTPGSLATHSVEREREIWAVVRPALESRKAAARARGFVGWSHASAGPVRYADEVR